MKNRKIIDNGTKAKIDNFVYGGFPISRKILNEQNTPSSGSVGGRNNPTPGSFTNPIDYLRGGGTEPMRIFPRPGDGFHGTQQRPTVRPSRPGQRSLATNPMNLDPMDVPLSDSFPEGSYPIFLGGQWYVIVGNQYVPAEIQNGQWVPSGPSQTPGLPSRFPSQDPYQNPTGRSPRNRPGYLPPYG